MPRDTLTANRDYYVNPSTGSDSNDGLSSSTSFATLAKAASIINLLDLMNYTVNVHAAAANYATGDTFQINANIPGNGDKSQIALTGDLPNCGAIINLSPNGKGIFANGGLFTCMGGFTIQSAGNSYLDGTCGMRAEAFGYAYCSGPMIYKTLEVPISGERCGIAYHQGGTVTFQGDQYYGQAALENGLTYLRDATVVVSGLTVHACFSYADRNSFSQYYNNSNSGTCSGVKYIADGQSYIFTNGALSSIPGSAGGSTRNGGTAY